MGVIGRIGGIAIGIGIGIGFAQGKSAVEKFGELGIDFDSGTIDVRGAGAPDLHPPSAEVARVKAERAARADALKRLREGLEKLPAERLGCRNGRELALAEDPAPETRAIEWGSDGSVVVVLRFSTEKLLAANDGARTGGRKLFDSDGGDCKTARAARGGR